MSVIYIAKLYLYLQYILDNLIRILIYYFSALRDDLRCAAQHSGTCPLLWDNLVRVEQAFTQHQLETVSDECQVSFDIYAGNK